MIINIFYVLEHGPCDVNYLFWSYYFIKIFSKYTKNDTQLFVSDDVRDLGDHKSGDESVNQEMYNWPIIGLYCACHKKNFCLYGWHKVYYEFLSNIPLFWLAATKYMMVGILQYNW